MSAGSTGSAILPKWQLAVILGAPIAIGLGYLLYRRTSSIDDSTPGKGKKKSLASLKDKSISIDGKDDISERDVSEASRKLINSAEDEPIPLKRAQIYKNEGNICFRKGKYDEAIELYDKAIEACPEENKMDLAIFYQNRAAAYEMLKKWNQVKADCSKSLEYNPKYVKAYFRRAKAHENTKDLIDCLDDITATCILEVFQNHNSIMFADRILKQTGQNDAAEGMKKRIPRLPSKYFVKTYFRGFASDPIKKIIIASSEPTGFVRAKMAFDSENYDDIVQACTEEIESSESESQYKIEAMLLRGTMNLLLSNFVEGQQDLDAIIKNPEADINIRVNALIKRASLFVQIDEKDLGMADFKEAEELDPKNPDIYHQRAQIYTLLEELDQALNEYEKAVKLAPENGIAYAQKCYAEYRIAFMSQDASRLMTVMNDFKNAVEKYPTCVECYSIMARVLGDQGQFDQAEVFYEKAIELAPDNANLLVHRGIMQLQWTADVDKAIEFMNRAIDIDQKCELAYETLGTIEVQRANLYRAVELFEKAIMCAKNQIEMAHLYALRNATVAQINVTQKLGIDISSMTQAVPNFT